MLCSLRLALISSQLIEINFVLHNNNNRKISERTERSTVFISADQCLDSEDQFNPLSRDFPG